jgi:hypothetical protein
LWAIVAASGASAEAGRQLGEARTGPGAAAIGGCYRNASFAVDSALMQQRRGRGTSESCRREAAAERNRASGDPRRRR